jgi:ubiquinone/menaquinone biosynthesis C-methylase UbiE
MDVETEFFTGLMEFNYGEKVEDKLKSLAKQISWAKGWPENDKSFWNAEAFMWQYKIDQQKRDLISKELSFLENGNNLDLGCGAYSYINSVGFDFSEKMLLRNDNLIKSVEGNLEKALPLDDGSFSSVTAVFVFNYIKNYSLLFKEVKRILDDNGYLVMILSAKSVNKWEKQKEVNSFSSSQWEEILVTNDFKVEFYEKENLWFFKCRKEKIIK